jgi:ATP-dependent helicase HrpA
MISDRARLHKRLEEIRAVAYAGKPVGEHVLRFAQDTTRAIAKAEARRALVPAITFPPDLPITERVTDISAAIAAHQVVVVCGETGSGKSTQLPKICLKLGRGVTGMIAHTQPRRIAARSVAVRLAEELGVPAPGGARPKPAEAEAGGSSGGPTAPISPDLPPVVGFKYRFTDKTSPATTLVKLLTDGILLAETQGDRLLEQYDTIIIDEAHERSLNIDFLLGYIHRILPQRPDLKVIITSATIDPERLSNHFGGPEKCPIINVSGRTYPVEIRYRPFEHHDIDEMEDRLEHNVVASVAELCSHGDGDILVFLPGEREIRETADILAEAGYGVAGRGGAASGPVTERIEVIPLYARLPAADQLKVFQPHLAGVGRRIILATNVAETSLTVPGIRYVIDGGLARISRYSPRTRVNRLPIEEISQASAAQRSGRCGRLGPGVAIRLYGEEDFAKRDAFTEPEILRTNLAAVVLQMLYLRLGDPSQFPFVQPPDNRLINDAFDTLLELGAVDEDRRLTKAGRDMARLPIDPRLARIILAGREEHCLREALVITAALSVQDPRERPLDKASEADAKHAIFRDEQSDFVSLLKLWKWFAQQEAAVSGSRLRRLCRENFLSFVRLREWQEIHRQLADVCRELSMPLNDRQATYEQVHRAVLAGLLSAVGNRDEKSTEKEYTGARGGKFSIFPGSGLFKKAPRWVVAAELVKTTKLYARCCAAVEPAWVEAAGAHLLKRSHSDPHYDEKTERVNCFQRVTLWGLELASRRRVHFGSIDPAQARDLFITGALVEGHLRSSENAPFARHNRDLLTRAHALQRRYRRADLLADASVRHAFFDHRLPKDVFTGEDLVRWRMHVEKSNPQVLFLSEREVLSDAARALSAADFPDTLALAADGSCVASLSYVNDPQHPADGITATLPVEAAGAADERVGQWLVPGLLKEKVETLVRSLPKAVRTHFVPPPQFAEQCLAEIARARLTAAEGYSLTEALVACCKALGDVEVAERDFDLAALPPYLTLTYRFTDAAGHLLAEGRDLPALRRQLRDRIVRSVTELAPIRYNREGLNNWDFGDLPERIDVQARGLKLSGYPALTSEQGRVGLRVFATPQAAAANHREGLRRLFVIRARENLERAVKHITDLEQLRMLYATFGDGKELQTSLVQRVAELAFLPDDAVVRLEADFTARLDKGRANLDVSANTVGQTVAGILKTVQSTLLAVESAKAPAHAAAVLDIKEQLDRLLEARFIARVPWAWLTQYPRYLAAISARLRKLTGSGEGLAKDERGMIDVQPRQEAFLWACRNRDASHGPDPALEQYRWMLEEFRVQTFAQELGTAVPVSGKRLDQLWSRIRMD